MSKRRYSFTKKAYEGVESLKNFSAKELMEYRKMLFKKTAQQIRFIKRLMGSSKEGWRLIEFCSGNGRVPICLMKTGFLRFALGIEISKSRVRFAEQWRKDLKLTQVQFLRADALKWHPSPEKRFDLSLCLTGAFQYFKPIRDSAPLELLSSIYESLKPGGIALFELYQIRKDKLKMLALNGGKLRTWEPLSDEDRFAYYLSEFDYVESKKIIQHKKIFIGKDGKIDAGRREFLAYYSKKELIKLIKAAGFKNAVTYADFQGNPYQEGKSSCLIVVAKKER